MCVSLYVCLRLCTFNTNTIALSASCTHIHFKFDSYIKMYVMVFAHTNTHAIKSKAAVSTVAAAAADDDDVFFLLNT